MLLAARTAVSVASPLLTRPALIRRLRLGSSVVCMKDKTGKTVKKENLPSKMCPACNRPFTWRKAWERCWDEVKYCSDRCRSEGKKAAKGGGSGDKGSAAGSEASAPAG